ncbi:uncharacterized protein LOC143276645 [Babylonia areolata]|uniref:uncharacterized protein LOC143276645 n=1 Tax=Babylonia areolata TaxID=304850 RepID=UPI003FD3DD0F
MMESPKAVHNPWYIALLVYNVIVLATVVVFGVLSSFAFSGASDFFFLNTQTLQWMRKFPVDVTPAEWTFHFAWLAVFAWQAAWLLYALLSLCRKSPLKEPLYASPYLLPPLLLGAYVLANGSAVAWMFLFDRGYVEAALAAMLLAVVLLIFATVLSYRSVDEGWVHLVLQEREFEAWLVTGFVHNGLALYASWAFFVASINLAVVITYTSGAGDVSSATSSTVALGVMAVAVVVYALADLCLLDRHTRYTLTPYLVTMVGLVGVVVEVVDGGWEVLLGGGVEAEEGGGGGVDRNAVMAVVLCGVGGLFLALKLVVTVARHVREGREEEED